MQHIGKEVYSNQILTLIEGEKRNPSNIINDKIVTISAPTWVNIIPITANEEVVFVKQYRYGTKKSTLEIPGGMVDDGESSLKAIQRELLEETGYLSNDITKLGDVSPNPALFTNKVSSYLAYDVQKISNYVSEESDKIEVITIPIKNVPNLIVNGDIDHALVITAFYLYEKLNNDI